MATGRVERKRTSQPCIFAYETKAGTRYRVVVSGKDPLTGKRVQETRGGIRTMTEAKKVRGELQANAGTVSGASWTVARLVERWLRQVEETGRVKPATLMKYERRLATLLPALGARRVAEVTAMALQDLYRALVEREGWGANTVEGLHVPVRAMFEQAVLWKLIPFNPARGVRLPERPPSIGRSWTAAEARRFLAAARDDATGPLWLLMVTTGIRIGEAIGLRWGDLDWGRAMVRIERTLTRNRENQRVVGDDPKTRSSRRTIVLTAGTVAALRRQRSMVAARAAADPLWRDEGYVFPGKHGGRWNEQTPRERFDRLCARAGVPRLRLHDLRHTAATLARRSGAEAEVVASRLGHGSVDQTRRYTHFDAAAQRPVVAGIARALGEKRDPSVTRRGKRTVSGGQKTAKRGGKAGADLARGRILDHAYDPTRADGPNEYVPVHERDRHVRHENQVSDGQERRKCRGCRSRP